MIPRWIDGVTEATQRWAADVQRRPVGPPRATPRPTALGPARALPVIAAEVQQILEEHTTHPTHPRHFGLFVPSVCPAAVVGDTFAAMYNLQLGARFYAPGATALEDAALDHLRDKLGFDSGDATFTSGGSEANLCGVLAALGRRLPAWREHGLAAAEGTPTFYASVAAHASFVKIARTTGLGANALRRISTDGDRKMRLDALKRAIDEDRRRGHLPLLVVATAGTTAEGAIDPLEPLAALCRAEDLWLHVDGAWGAAAVLSPSQRPHVAGIALADSVTWDAHKTLPVPAGAGMFFTRHADALAPAFDVRTAYVPEQGSLPDAYRRTPQWSRRCIGLKVYMTLAALGDDGLARLVDHQAAMGRLLRTSLRDAGYHVTNDSPLPVVTFTDAALRGDATRDWIERVVDSGEAWVSPVVLQDGRVAVRACITHHDTQPSDIIALIAALERHHPDPASRPEALA